MIFFIFSTIIILVLALHYMVINDVIVVSNDDGHIYDSYTLDIFVQRFIRYVKVQSTASIIWKLFLLVLCLLHLHQSYSLTRSTYVKNVKDIKNWLSNSMMFMILYTVFTIRSAIGQSEYSLAFGMPFVFVVFCLYRGIVESFYDYERGLNKSDKVKLQKKEHICDNSSTSHLLEGFHVQDNQNAFTLNVMPDNFKVKE